MNRLALISVVILTGCTLPHEATCPAIESLGQRDAVADARAALAKGDRHLLMLGGFVGEVPGVSETGTHPTRMIEGTSDATTEACRRQRSAAEAYAAKYNQEIARAD